MFHAAAAAAAKSLQSCPTLCNPRDGSPLLLHPWDSPGKNTGVGCHFLLQCMKVKSESEVAQLCPTLFDSMDCRYLFLIPSKVIFAFMSFKGSFKFSSNINLAYLIIYKFYNNSYYKTTLIVFKYFCEF